MALQIRRGTAAQRTGITPAAGELLYTTDTKLVYVGDGTTAGGNIISGGGGGISDIVNDTSPQLGGDLDVNGRIITSANNADVTINPNGTGSLILQSGLSINSAGNIEKTGELNFSSTGEISFGRSDGTSDANVYQVRNTHSPAFTAGYVFAQHHNTADAVNFNFYRTRGTGSAPTIVQNGDELGEIAFLAWGGTTQLPGASITVAIEGTPTSSRMPSRISFVTDNGTNIARRAELSSAGVWKCDQLASFSSTAVTMPTSNYLQIGDVRLSQSGLSTTNSNSNLFITANSSGRVYIDGSGWPSSLGTAGQFLTTDGAGSLSWGNAPGSAVRTTAQASTTSVANGGTVPVLITGFKTYSLLKIQTSHAAWVRLYVSDAARTADAVRTEGVDPAPGAGVLAEVVTTGGQTILMSPGVFGWSNESPANTNIPCAVTNKSGSTAIITVTLTLIQLEA